MAEFGCLGTLGFPVSPGVASRPERRMYPPFAWEKILDRSYSKEI